MLVLRNTPPNDTPIANINATDTLRCKSKTKRFCIKKLISIPIKAPTAVTMIIFWRVEGEPSSGKINNTKKL